MAQLFPVGAAEFHIDLADGNFVSGLGLAAQHRQSHKEDVIIIDLPSRIELTKPISLVGVDFGNSPAPLIFRGSGKAGTVITGAIKVATRALTAADSNARIPAHALPSV